MKKRMLGLIFALIMTFQPLSTDAVDGRLYLTFVLNGHLYEMVDIEDANEMLINTVADGIESVITDDVVKKLETQRKGK